MAHQVEQHARRRQDQDHGRGAADGGEPAERLVAEGASEAMVEQGGVGEEEQPARQPRIGDHHPAQQVVVDRLGAGARQLGALQQAARHSEHLLTHVLDAAELQIGGCRGRRVVVELAADEGEVEARVAEVAGDREIGSVRHAGIDVARQGAGGGAGRRALEQADHAAVALARLEHQGPAARPLRLHVQHRADAAGEGIGFEEQPGADVAGLLAVGEQQHQIAWLHASGLHRARHLQRDGHVGAVVRSAGRAGDRVVVGHQRDGGPAAVAAGQHADHVLVVTALYVDGGRIEAVGDGLAGLQAGLQPQAAAAEQDVVAHPVMLGRAGRVRLGPDLLHVGERAAGGETQDGGVGEQRGGRPRGDPRQRAGESEARDQGCGSKHALDFPRSPTSRQGTEP